MMGRTHAMAGIATLWLLEPLDLITLETVVPLVTAALFGAFLPDLDASESKLKRLSVGGITPFVPLSVALNRAFGHRGLLHSAAGLAIATLVCSLPTGYWLGWPAAVALFLGYASHLLADAMTKSGIPLLYPKRRRYYVLPRGWRVTTGSLAEDAIFPLFACAVLLLLLSHLHP